MLKFWAAGRRWLHGGEMAPRSLSPSPSQAGCQCVGGASKWQHRFHIGLGAKLRRNKKNHYSVSPFPLQPERVAVGWNKGGSKLN
jgi:hypothetical protein